MRFKNLDIGCCTMGESYPNLGHFAKGVMNSIN